MNGTKKKQSHIARWIFLPLAALAWSSTVAAADYPNRPLRLVVSFPPGGSADFQARIIGTRLTEQLGQQLIKSDLVRWEKIIKQAGIRAG